MSDKIALRAQFKQIRSAAKSAEKDALIAANVLRSPLMQAESFFVYCSVKSEVSTYALIDALLAAGKRVCVPRIEGGAMLCVPYDRLEEGAFSIPAPRGGEDAVCDVALVPLLAVDERGVRLGYGGGYYDAYFARRPHVFRVGLAYEAQRTRSLARDPWDAPLHALVTEAGLLSFRTLDSGGVCGV